MRDQKATVAVVGLGAVGLVTVKNLVEEGFDVTGFESNNYIGGVWHYTEENQTSVLESTIVNISKERGCFTDYAFPESVPSHASAKDVQQYLESYAQHFDLEKRFRLGVSVQKIKRDEADKKWVVEMADGTSARFDKVVVSTGPTSHPNMPKISGVERLAGDYIHSQAFKRPEPFKGKRVLLIGLGNTTADTVEALRGHASEIYISHAKGICILPRTSKEGIPSDHTLTLRKINFLAAIDRYAPTFADWMINNMITKLSRARFTMRPEWRLSPALPLKYGGVIVSDNLVANFAAGVVKSVPAVTSILDGSTVQLSDGSTVTVDSIICCTGYRKDFSLVDCAVDPTRDTLPSWFDLPGAYGKPLPRLYQNIFSLDHPDSLAFMGCVWLQRRVPAVWAGKSALPSVPAMNAAVDAHHRVVCARARQGPTPGSWVRQSAWEPWAHATAGTGLVEHLGWGWKGWVFWWRNRAEYKLLVDGIYSPFLLRVFDGKRKKWDGARDAIAKLNRK
ncbi:dimethylaniline monooxygenase 2 [Cordyceps militaris]|uniref:Dimethylaniline monooxygenase 2 n=1 Tax=Cordyceps militaris TaxID=73501 RepID=A0A2H4SHZ6_CORMI|nr:dimethylaniline monooxygenase 2 [Cordyceps militaris]